MHKSPSFTVFFLGIILMGISGNAQATSSAIDPVYACAEIKENAARLACYDQSVAALKAKQARKEIVVVDEAEVKRIKKEAFGFNIPSLPKLSLPGLNKGEKRESLSATVKSVRKSGGKYYFTLGNGQVWREVGQNQLRRLPKGTLTATIKPKALGSYMLRLNNGNRAVGGIRVKRVK